MDDVQPANTDQYEEISGRVRTQLSWRCEGMLKALDQMFLDDPTALTAGMVSAYSSVVKTYASLWRVQDRPVDRSAMLPAAVVEAMVESARIEAAQQALEAERSRVREESLRALERADSGVRTNLERIRARRET